MSNLFQIIWHHLWNLPFVNKWMLSARTNQFKLSFKIILIYTKTKSSKLLFLSSLSLIYPFSLRCVKCGFSAFVSDAVRWFECLNEKCGYYQCKICGRPATKAHEIRSCEEMGIVEVNPPNRFHFYNS